MSTLTTTAIYQNGVLLPKVKPDFPLREVVVVYVPATNIDEDEDISPAWKSMIAEAEADVREGRIVGPFHSADDLIASLRQ